MDNQELLDNLQGQKYINGYIVNEQVPNFVEVKKSIRLNTDVTKMREIGQNEIFVKRPKEKSPISRYRQINVISADMDHFDEHREFQMAKRVNVQIQNRINERLVNQISTSYAPQASTLAELKALQTTRPQLQQELEAVEEYAKTHYLTEAQKTKLKEEVYKKNYDQWKAGIESVKTGTANTQEGIPEREKEQFPRDPVIPSGPNLNEKSLRDADIIKYGDLVDMTSLVGETQIRRMAEQLINPSGELMQNIKNDQRGYLVFQNLLILLTNNRNLFIDRIEKQINKSTTPLYIRLIVQNINRVYQSIYKIPFIKNDIKKLKKLSNNSLQYIRLMDILFKIFQYVRLKIPRQYDDTVFITVSNTNEKKYFGTSNINIVVGDLLIKTFNEYVDYRDNYTFAYAQKQGTQQEIEIDAGNIGGRADG